MPPQQILTPIPFGQPTEARVLRKIRALPLLRLLLTPLAKAERNLSLLLAEARPAPFPHGSFLCLLTSPFLMARSGRLILIMLSRKNVQRSCSCQSVHQRFPSGCDCSSTADCYFGDKRGEFFVRYGKSKFE